MTPEEKIKAYDKALERANVAYKDEDRHLKVTLERIFPELRESENERIRKWIINEIKINHHNLDDDNVDFVDKAIAWLENQGEKINLPQFTFDDILALQCCMETVKNVQEDKELYEQLQSLHDKLHDAYWLKKQGEEKPATDIKVIIPKFRVGDIVKSKSQPMLSPRKIISIDKDCYRCEDGGCIGFAWEDDCEIVEQKTTEWSKKDEKEVAVLEAYIRSKDWNEKHIERALGIIDTLVNKFKSLRPQPKQEWSEDDVVHLNNCISFISRLSASEMNWLKSLKDRVQSQSQWKPSDKQ